MLYDLSKLVTLEQNATSSAVATAVQTGPIEPIIALKPSDLYHNRELSQLAFHERVVELAEDESVPLLERVRFLAISSSNLDEYFEIRVAGLKKQVEFGSQQQTPDGLTASAVLLQIHQMAQSLVERQYRVLNDRLFPAMEKQGIRFLRRKDWDDEQTTWVKQYFENQLLPVVSPIRLDPSHPFPRLLNKALHYIISLDGTDAFGQAGGMAVLAAPRHLPRIVRLPSAPGKHDFAFLSSVIHAHVEELFPGLIVTGCYQFRVTRNSELLVDSEEVEDLKAALQGELPARRYGEEVRLEVAQNCPDHLTQYLLSQCELGEQDLYKLNGPISLTRLTAVPDLIPRQDLKYPLFVPALPPQITPGCNLFKAIAQGDILLHHPYQSFSVVIDLVRQAAADPDVVAIKQTLYRTGSESGLEEALLAAAHAGKVVTVVVELLARFDEAANISLADRLQEAGAQVMYGVVGYKTHAKMLMIVRREGDTLRRYVHLSTGNYHARTAKQYTDVALLTCQPEIGEDVHKVFLQLTSLGSEPKLKKLFLSPFTMHREMLRLIGQEAQNAKHGKPARIIAKMNALTEPRIIEALYAASQDGVEIDLILRGTCCLRPGVPGVSERIRVRSILGRFLEHTRIFYFENEGNSKIYLASADWMVRNMHNRIEIAFPIEDARLKKSVLEHALMPYLRDSHLCWTLDGAKYRRVSGEGEPFSAQNWLIKLLCDHAAPQPIDVPRKSRRRKGETRIRRKRALTES